MQVKAFFTSLLFSIPAFATSVTYDSVYDNPNGSMLSVACSNGKHGLASKWPTFGKVPGFPHIGGAQAVTGWNSPQCGTCWELSFTNDDGKTKKINVVAIDYAGNGFNIAQAAMDELTDGHAVEYGVVDVQSKQVSPIACGIKS